MKQRILFFLAALIFSASQSLWAYTVEIGTSLMITSTGTISVDKTSCNAGETVTVTPSPAAGYAVDYIKYLDENYQEIAFITPVNGVYSFTMPDQNVIVMAAFMKLLTHTDITIDAIADQTYTGSALEPAVTVWDGEGEKEEITDKCDITYSNNTNAGTATVTIKAKADANYAGETTTTFKINPKTVTSPTIILSATSATYNGQDQKPTVTEVKDGNAVISATEYTVSYKKGSEVVEKCMLPAEYTVVINDVAGGNYIVSGSAKFTITKADPEPDIIYPLDLRGLVYNGMPQNLISSGEGPEGTTMWYRIESGPEGKTDWSKEIPTGTKIGQYSIEWKLEGNNIYDDYGPDIIYAPTLINRATINSVELESGYHTLNQYDKKKPTVRRVYAGENDKLQVPEECYEVTYPSEITKIGQYELKVSAKDVEENNFTGSATATFTIIPDVIELPSRIEGLIYNGQPQALFTSGETNGGGKVVFSLDYGPFVEDIPMATNAGKYYVQAKIVGSNGEEYGYGYNSWGDVTIAQAEIKKVEIDKTELSLAEYKAKKPVAKAYIGANSDIVLPESDYEVTYPQTITAAGDYEITVSPKSGNVTGSAKATFKIAGNADPEVTVPTAIDGLVYNGKAQALVKAGTCPEGTKMLYRVQNGIEGSITWSVDIPTGINAGDYIVEWKVEGNELYKDTDVKKITITIAQAEITKVELDKTEFKYTGSVQCPTVTKVYAGKNSDLEVAADWYQVDYPLVAIAVDEYELTVSAKAITGNNFTGSAKATFKITGTDTGTDKQDPVVTYPEKIEGLVYNGQPQALFTPGTCVDGLKFLYRIEGGPEGETNWSEDVPKGTKAGKYRVAFKFDGNDKYADVGGSYEVSIASPVETNGGTVIGLSDAAKGVLENGGEIHIPSTTADGQLVTGIADGALSSAGENVTLVIGGGKEGAEAEGDPVILFGQNAVGNANVQVPLVLLDQYADQENLKPTVEGGKLFSVLKKNKRVSTFSSRAKIKLPSVVKAYTCFVNQNKVVECVPIGDKVYSNNGVLLAWINNTKIQAKITALLHDSKIAKSDKHKYENNMLVPVTKKSNFKNTKDYTYFVLYYGEFRKIKDDGDSHVSPNKAVLKVPNSLFTGNPSAARSFAISGIEDQDEATAISAALNDGPVVGNDAWYSISGQRIDQPTAPGIYIRNGKKVIVK